jgi:hypothetical protein
MIRLLFHKVYLFLEIIKAPCQIQSYPGRLDAEKLFKIYYSQPTLPANH